MGGRAGPSVHAPAGRRGLRKTYGATVAVDHVDLTVARGEIFALLGPNGAGKTTTVEILEGYRDRDGGELRILGVDASRADPDWRSRIGIVLQASGEFEELLVAEVVEHFAGCYPRPDDPGKVLERVGLGAKRTAKARTLSGGQLRRLDVAPGIFRPDPLRLGLRRARLELTQFFRGRESVVFLFAFPVLLLVVFGAIIDREIAPGVTLTEFISGVFCVFTDLPQWMQQVAAVFPLKWMAQGMRAVFLPEEFAGAEAAGGWELGRVAVVLGAWVVAGALLCLTTFRWDAKGER